MTIENRGGFSQGDEILPVSSSSQEPTRPPLGSNPGADREKSRVQDSSEKDNQSDSSAPSPEDSGTRSRSASTLCQETTPPSDQVSNQDLTESNMDAVQRDNRIRSIQFAHQDPPTSNADTALTSTKTNSFPLNSKDNSSSNLPKMKRTPSNLTTDTTASSQSKKKSFAGYSNANLPAPAHAMNWREVAVTLEANVEDGLSADVAQQRMEEYGPNELGDDEGVKLWKIITSQFGNMMTLVLIAAMAVSFAIGSYIEGAVVAAVITMNVVIGSWQEYKAAKTMDSLRNLSSPTANVVRDGSNKTVSTREVVVGDMVEMKMGDTVPADIRLIEAVNFETDEAMLTGESLPARKEADMVVEPDAGAGDRANVAFSTSTVTKGRAKGIVYATGMSTGIGSIAENLRQKDRKIRKVKRGEDGKAAPHRYVEAAAGTGWDILLIFLGITVGTPLQRKLSWLAMILLVVAVVCAIIVLAANEFSNDKEVIIYAVATGLSMIPASLVAILIITMGNGTRAMGKRNVIVRNTKSLESLGSVTDICSDKTGTITQGKMIVARAWLPSPNGGTIIVDQTGHPFNPTNASLEVSLTEPSAVDVEKCEVLEPTVNDDQVQLRHFLNIASLANLAIVHPGKEENKWIARGDPTEIAIQVFAARFNWNRTRWTSGENARWKQIAEFPFDSSIKRMSVIFDDAETNQQWIFTKGAVERVIDRCTLIHDQCEERPSKMTQEHREDILKQMDSLASLGLRTLALASRKVNDGELVFTEEQRESIEQNLIFRGIVGIYDPPRPESAPSVKMCSEAGIIVHMVSLALSLFDSS